MSKSSESVTFGFKITQTFRTKQFLLVFSLHKIVIMTVMKHFPEININIIVLNFNTQYRLYLQINT